MGRNVSFCTLNVDEVEPGRRWLLLDPRGACTSNPHRLVTVGVTALYVPVLSLERRGITAYIDGAEMLPRDLQPIEYGRRKGAKDPIG